MDYRALNKITIRDCYPIPLILDMLDRLYTAKVFFKLDLRLGYWQVRIAKGDERKTVCVTRYGSYEFWVMPYGLTNVPATFCSLMNSVLAPFLDDFMVVYIDDIVGYSASVKEHLAHLRVILQKLRENQLYLKLGKCSFMIDQITFLGHMVGH